MKTIAILTSTYNRAKTLDKLYDSLLEQTSYDFKWYIVDDGSTDNTEEQCRNYSSEKFEVIYIKKENGGKHTAVNEGLKLIEEKLTFIVDSDDYLTNDAVETIVSDWEKHKDTEQVCGLCYYKMFYDGGVVGDEYDFQDPFADTYINTRVNNACRGDKAEVYVTDVLRAYPFPVFDNEKFLSEAVVWNKIAIEGYKLVYISKGIYYCEYRSDGLSSKARKNQLQNPKGTMLHAKMHLVKRVKFKIKCKYMIMYIAMAKFAGVSYKEAYKSVDYKLLFIAAFLPSMLLKSIWGKLRNDL